MDIEISCFFTPKKGILVFLAFEFCSKTLFHLFKTDQSFAQTNQLCSLFVNVVQLSILEKRGN